VQLPGLQPNKYQRGFTLLVQSGAAAFPTLSFHVVTGASGMNDAAAARPDAFFGGRRRTAGWTRLAAHNAGAWRHNGMVASRSPRLTYDNSQPSRIAYALVRTWSELLSVEQIAANVLFGDHSQLVARALVRIKHRCFASGSSLLSSMRRHLRVGSLIDESAPLVGCGAPVENTGREELDF
jgi:hypothetical protein